MILLLGRVFFNTKACFIKTPLAPAGYVDVSFPLTNEAVPI